MSTAASASHPSPRPWSPDGNDHLTYQWVKMEGKTQSWVAQQLGLSQSTVSRIIHRYERWQAHTQEREAGRLGPTERLRAQRWQAFDRNEQILASCLRIANELEGFVDSSRSTIRRPLHKPSQENEIRTENFTIDRTGSVARFLRLAFRINMEQLKLAQLDPPPLPQPLSAEDLADQALQSAEIALAFNSRPTTCASSPTPPTLNPEPETSNVELETVNIETVNIEPETLNSSPLHNLHTKDSPQIAATTAVSSTCEQTATPDKISQRSRIPHPPRIGKPRKDQPREGEAPAEPPLRNTSNCKTDWPSNGKSKRNVRRRLQTANT